MKKLICIFACTAIMSGIMSFSAAAETGQVYWFGTNENGYTEDFEGDGTALENKSGNAYNDGTSNRVITGTKSYTIESNSDKGTAKVIGTLKSSDGTQKEQNEFNIENIACSNIGGIHMTSLANYTSLIVDDIYVSGAESAVVKPEPMPEGVYADESFDSFSFGKLTMSSKLVSVSNQDNTVTLGINSGRNGGDSSTYLQTGGAEDKYITFHSGRFANSNRHPFLSINNAPSFSELDGMDFVLECDINMNGKDSVPVLFGDGSNGISFALKDGVININGSPVAGTSKNTWYRIVITADGSNCDVLINGNHISTSLNGAQKLSRIDFGKNTADGGDLMAVNNLKAYSNKKTSASVGEIKKLNDEIIIGDDGYFANAYNFKVDPGDFSVNKVTVNVNDTPQTKTTNISQGPCIFGIIILSEDLNKLTSPEISVEIE